MNPVTQTRLTLFSQHKAHHLEAEDERMAGVLALIVTLAEGGPAPMTAAELLNEIGRLGRASLVGATPPDPH
ncbi:hypothetical protein R69927_05330 [Paraburkholderia domus]|jgi:hypothetical protein|uniref:Uncharacterized protein n=1 Tax=Paraburkholderia domus TaxID=2793075 RepID=A0A9N8R2R2_9BURK|nr:hypothetical protein [Paraburkholderia domus]MBK5064710.1 hypothetical protein [Burkholderia sp. R-70199]MBK5089532.1 hypothetical protein [Burkholderia sp. R-69927]MBK5168688.1 hypothetical protein [Burkholderia sp. R-70211]MBK5183996.1 hypothetical protein [Burkholderia sp. R-69749]MCI0149886.1 hypothetical protein [Paraburkholderia sediminicola]